MGIGLADYEMEFRGLRFGGVDGSRPVGIRAIRGLQDFDARIGDTPIPRADGSVPGQHTVKSKEVQLHLLVNGVKGSDTLEHDFAAARAAFQRTDTPEQLYFKMPGQDESFIWARCIGRTEKKAVETAFGQRQLIARLVAADPRIYGSDQKSQTFNIYDGTAGGTNLPLGAGGTGFVVNFSADTSSETILHNAGDAPAYPLIRVYGPITGTCTAVKLTNTTTGQTSTFNTTIATGQTLSIDMRRIITADPSDTPYVALDGSNRYGDWALPREPFYIAPGDNAIRFEITGTSTNVKCVITYRDTSL